MRRSDDSVSTLCFLCFRLTCFSWSKDENHHITDQLLRLTEDPPLWKAVFGFDKGTSGSAVATGKNNLKHCANIAVALFIDNVAAAS